MSKSHTKRTKKEPKTGSETDKSAAEEPTVEDLVEAVAADVQASTSAAEKPAAEEPTVEDLVEAVEAVVGAAGEEVQASGEEEPGTDETLEERDPEAEIVDLNDKLLRALAETENLRRRARKEREDTANYAVASFARDLLSVADNLGRALGALPETLDETGDVLSGFIEGVRLTERELANVMERHGIEKVAPTGEKFDPNRHEAMFEIPTGAAAPGTVVQVVEIGYVLKERLLRAAKVGVARPLPESEEGESVDTTA